MTDFTIADKDIVDQHENILIHVYYNLLNYDYRMGLFTDESSIYDMGGTGLTDEDYIYTANQYYKQANDSLSYVDGQKLYYKILNQSFDKMIFEKFHDTYGFNLDQKIHLLKDIALLLNEKFPDRDWDTDNIFILKKFDTDFDRKEKEIQEQKENNNLSNITKFPIRKKPTPEEILNGSNEFLMTTVLGMSFADAEKLAKENYNKKMQGKKFEPYLPEKTNKINNPF